MNIEELMVVQKKLQFDFDTSIIGYQGSGIVEEPSYRLTTQYTFAIPNLVRVEVNLPEGGKYVEGFDGSYAWELDKYVDGEAESALRHGAEWINPLKSLEFFTNRGHTVEYKGSILLDDTQFYRVLLTQDDGYQRQYFFDINTYLPIISRDVRPLHPGEEYKEIESLYLDYREVEGIRFPFKHVEREVGTKNVLMEVTYENIEILRNISDTFFSKLK